MSDGPLDNPYIAEKLRKLQDQHVQTEELMDRLYREQNPDHAEKMRAEAMERSRVRRALEAERREKSKAHGDKVKAGLADRKEEKHNELIDSIENNKPVRM